MRSPHPAQFVLGPAFPVELDSWQRLELGGGLELRVHPGLGATRVTDGERSLTVLGYLLDPLLPERSDQEIVEALLASSAGLGDLAERTAHLGGRWALVFRDGRETYVLHDAAGLRQVVYGKNEDGFWCASEPHFLASLMNAEIDPEAASFIAAADFASMPGGRWWPGSRTPFARIRRLLPNHALRLSDCAALRYWPTGPVPPQGLSEGADAAAGLIRGQTEAAAHRYDLTLLLTAGRDSRVCLAAAGRVNRDVDCLTIGSAADRDVRDASALCVRFGLRHRVVANTGLPTREFWQEYAANSPLADRSYAASAEAIAPHLGRRRVAVLGGVGEVAKTYYRRRALSTPASGAELLLALSRMGRHPYALAAFAEWLDAAERAERHGIDPLDLFYWEQRAGSWLASWMLEYDMVWRDAFVPFNCRAVLTSLLGVNARFRTAPYELHRSLIETLWPALLAEPFGDDARRGLRARLGSAWEKWRTAWWG